MKKLVTAAITTAILTAIMTSCGTGTYECSMCDRTYEGKGNKVKRDGVTAILCDDCYELYQLAEEFLGDEFDE